MINHILCANELSPSCGCLISTALELFNTTANIWGRHLAAHLCCSLCYVAWLVLVRIESFACFVSKRSAAKYAMKLLRNNVALWAKGVR